ncbi:MAG: hypothetical protein NDI90_00140 [Nitrospira sp. BO4]|jgi:hypothetical protein|nr:hypothetical protein [Nitrospira sp. BO4]
MKDKYLSITLFALLSLIAVGPLHAQANRLDSENVEQMKANQIMVEGVVTQIKSGLYTVRTTTGTNYTLAESVAVRYGRDVPRVGDEMILWINDGNDIIEAMKKGAENWSPRFVSGKLVSINYGDSQITLSMAGGEQSYKLRPESRMFRDMSVGTAVTIAVNKEEEVIDVHVDKDSEVPRSSLGHPDNESALKGFRHLGKPE